MTFPQSNAGSVTDMLAQRMRGRGMSGVTRWGPNGGTRLTAAEANANGPYQINTGSGLGPGAAGYRGTGVIGSAAGPLGSKGMPTSQRGRFEKFGPNAAMMTTSQASSIARRSGLFGGTLKELYDMNPRPVGAPVSTAAPQAPTAVQPPPVTGESGLGLGLPPVSLDSPTTAPISQLNPSAATAFGNLGGNPFQSLMPSMQQPLLRTTLNKVLLQNKTP